MMKMALGLLTILVPVQLELGDLHGLNTLEYQPAKLAAIEAHWETGRRIPLILFAVPDDAHATDHDVLEIPDLGSLILTHDPNGLVRGLKEWPPDERPPVALPFFAFRIMVGLGLLMLALIAWSWWVRLRGKLFTSAMFLRACELAAPIGFLAVIAGRTVTEVGRQPWTVYGLLRTADSVSPSLTGTDVAVSFAGYAIVYLIMYPVGIRHIFRIVQRGPAAPATEPEPIESGRPEPPIHALQPSEPAVQAAALDLGVPGGRAHPDERNPEPR